jgi:hypothetical protein
MNTNTNMIPCPLKNNLSEKQTIRQTTSTYVKPQLTKLMTNSKVHSPGYS